MAASAREDNLACIETLLAHGADPNAANANGNTPLHVASTVEAAQASV